MHKVPETGVQDSVAEPVQWAREEEEKKEPGFSNRKHELEKRGGKGIRRGYKQDPR